MPIEEYAAVSPQQSNADITVVSRQCDAAGAELFSISENAPCIPEADIRSISEDSEYTMRCRGTLSAADSRIFLRYREPPTEDGDVCDTEISFDISAPDCVTVTRSGSVSASFVIHEGARSISVYSTPFGPLEMCVWAKKVQNSMTADGGSITMDYTVELKGMTAQRTRLTVSAEKHEK